MISAFLSGRTFLRGALQKYAKNSIFENFEGTLYSTSGSMLVFFLGGGGGEQERICTHIKVTFDDQKIIKKCVVQLSRDGFLGEWRGQLIDNKSS